MATVIDTDYNNEYFDRASEVIIVPKVEDIRIQDPEVYMQRLAELQTPKERLIEFFRSQFNFTCDSTHEASIIRSMGFYGLSFGWLFGGLARSSFYFDSFQRQYNAAAFDSDHRAKRFYVDNYVYKVLRQGAKYGVGSCLFCTTVGLIGLGSITYRNKLYLPDWLIGFGVLGGVSRCFLGVKGVVFGTGLGLLGGGLTYGGVKLFEITSGHSVTQLRYLSHMEYLERRDAQLDHMYAMREQADRDMLAKIR